MNTLKNLYEKDFYGWTQHQASMLRSRNMANLDFENLIEEIESMGKSEQRELESRLEVLLMHLLKWQHQPEKRSTSWELTIEEQRRRLDDHIQENPSLKPKIPDAQTKAYRYATFRASKETGIPESRFSAHCPWKFEQVMDQDFWPQA